MHNSLYMWWVSIFKFEMKMSSNLLQKINSISWLSHFIMCLFTQILRPATELKMNLDSLVNLMNVRKQKRCPVQIVFINLPSIAVAPLIWCATKMRLINYHVAGTMVMNLWREIWFIHQNHRATNACAMKNSIIKRTLRRIQAANRLNVVLNCISWAIYN